MIQTDLEAFDASRPRTQQTTLGPSDVGGCLRQSAYHALAVPVTDPQRSQQARMGTLLHLGYAAVIRTLYGPECSEVDVDLPGLGTGHVDYVDWRQRIVTDLKTVNDRAWDRWLTAGPPQHAWDQCELYAYGLICAAESPTPQPWTLRLLVLNRETGEEAEFEQAADPKHGAALLAYMVERQQRLQHATHPEEMPREGPGPGAGFPCDWCSWASVCWPQPPEGSDLSPQAMTIADDPEMIEAWLSDYMTAAALEAKAKQAKREARAHLQGLDGGTYGGAVLRWQGGNVLGEEPDPDAMAGLLDDLGYDVPTRQRVSARSIRVTKAKPAAKEA